MNWTIHKTPERSFVTVVCENDFNILDHQKMVEDIVSRDFWKPGMDVLFDHRKLQFNSTGYQDMMRASDTHQKYEKEIGDGKAAILMNSLADFGRGRQFELITVDKVSARLAIFLDEQKAIDWLTL